MKEKTWTYQNRYLGDIFLSQNSTGKEYQMMVRMSDNLYFQTDRPDQGLHCNCLPFCLHVLDIIRFSANAFRSKFSS